MDALTDQGKNALALAIDKGYMDIARLLFHRTSGTEHRRSAHFWHPENQQKDCNWTAGRTGGRERSGWVASFPCTDRGQRYAARFFDLESMRKDIRTAYDHILISRFQNTLRLVDHVVHYGANYTRIPENRNVLC